MIITATAFPQQILSNSLAQFTKFRKILWCSYPQIPCIAQQVGVVVLTDNTSKYKEFIVACHSVKKD